MHSDEKATVICSSDMCDVRPSVEFTSTDSDDPLLDVIAAWNRRALSRATQEAVTGELAEWEDQRVQLVYELLCDQVAPPAEEHWEGFSARRIVAALFPSADAPPAPSGKGEAVAWRYRRPASVKLGNWYRFDAVLWDGMSQDDRGQLELLFASPAPAIGVTEAQVEAVMSAPLPGGDEVWTAIPADRRRDFIRAALRAALPDGAGWRDMDSAPKDGTRFDAWRVEQATGTGHRVTDVYWDAEFNEWTHGSRSFQRPVEAPVHAETDIPVVALTHWRPLPAAPEPKP
jgi:hypothetical protein